MFVIACKYYSKFPYVIDCVKSIREYRPESKILVVDSDSEDKSYFDAIKPYNPIIADIANRNYVEGALWYAYHNYKDEKGFWILHDSATIHDDLLEYEENDFCSMAWFDGPHWCDGPKRERETWSRNIFDKTDLTFIEGAFPGIYGSMFYASMQLMNKLYSLKAHFFIPTSKDELEAMERVWGMIFLQLGFDVRKFTVNGPIPNFTKITKRWPNRR